MMKKWKMMICFCLLSVIALCGCQKKSASVLSADSPVVVTVWNYYNGAQKESFDQLVSEFNETIGLEKGIIVDAVSKGTITELENALRESADKKVGSDPLPQAAGAYANTAYELNEKDILVDLKQYMSEEELAEYVDAYLEEGRFESDTIKLFPIAKATELLIVNMTDWEPFAEANDLTETSFETWEGIAHMAKLYYEWTDAQTELAGDGKAMFGRDAFANYIQVGSRQLGHELYQVENGTLTVDLDQETMRNLWDNYYTPYIHGYFASFGKFRSDDMKTGDLIAFVGSTSGSAYSPTSVTKEDGTSYEITCKPFPLPGFDGKTKSAVQQGAGIVVLKSDEQKELATVEFLKWFTDNEQNLSFSVASGYLPVKKHSNTETVFREFIEAGSLQVSPIVVESIEIGMMQAREYDMYTAKPFAGGTEARGLLDTMSEKAAEDRAEVLANIDQGQSLEEAVMPYTTDENFTKWYEETRERMRPLEE